MRGCAYGWPGGLDDTHTPLIRHRCPGKETTKEVTNSFLDADSSQTGENALCSLKNISHLILDTLVPFFSPLTSLILTHHLNKEVRAMIKSCHSMNEVARQMLGPNSVRNSTSASNTPPVLSVTKWLQCSVDLVELNPPVGVHLWHHPASPVTCIQSHFSGYLFDSM